LGSEPSWSRLAFREYGGQHELAIAGFQFACQEIVLTVWSPPNYRYVAQNAANILKLSEGTDERNRKISYHITLHKQSFLLEMVSQNKEGIPSDQQMWIVAEKN
jgi:hypothetical protein